MHNLILYNANVIPLRDDNARTELVAISNGRISWVGEKSDLSLLKGPNTRAIDCQGYTLVPGFIDAHCHVLAYASSLMAMDCSPAAVRSIEDIQAALRKGASAAPIDQWVRGAGYNEFYLEERRHPTRWDLDKASPNYPVRLSHRSGHALVLNSLALSLAGITSKTEEPPGGVIERDIQTGEPTGLLLEMNDYMERVMPPLGEALMAEGLREANRRLLSFGVTSVQDATPSNSLERWLAFRRIKEEGIFLPRVTFMIGAKHIQEFLEADLAVKGGDEKLSLGAVKVVLTATSGALNPPEDELWDTILRIHGQGFQVAIHAVEAQAVLAAGKALSQAIQRVPRRDHRHRIEHCSECPPEVLRELKGKALLVVTQPAFIYHSGERYLAEVPQEMQPWLYRMGSFAKAGLAPSASSDAPVVPPNPLLGLYAAVTRMAETGRLLSPEEASSPLEALKAYTLNGAYAAFQEKERGTVEVGKLADLALLDGDPTMVEPEHIRDIRVMMTVLGGEIVWQR